MVCVQFASKGQISTILANEFEDSAKTRVGIIGEYSLNSNALTTKFISKFYTGGHLDTDLKNSVLNRLGSKNRIGADINYGIYATFKLDSLFHKKNVDLFFSLREREHFDALFSEDLYRVGFYGNAQYAGKVANFNGFNLNIIRYQQLQVGISYKLDSGARLGFGISFLKGVEYLSVLAKKAELFTSEDGQYIDFNTSMSVMQSDSANKGMGAFNGSGVSVDLYFEAPYKTKFGVSKLRVSVSDIGFIHFNQQSLTLKQDSLFHYTGVNVNSIFDMQSSTFSKTSQDSITNAVAPLKKESFNATLPTILNVSIETQFSKKISLMEGIRYMYNANYTLFVYLKGSYAVTKTFILSATFGYGGYGKFNYGLGASAKLGKGFIINGGCSNIEGYIAPSKACGQGAYLSLVKQF